ncbi:MAG: hypothetical protein AAFQ58_06060 [Pseudomonadota bacterium]
MTHFDVISSLPLHDKAALTTRNNGPGPMTLAANSQRSALSATGTYIALQGPQDTARSSCPTKPNTAAFRPISVHQLPALHDHMAPFLKSTSDRYRRFTKHDVQQLER